MESSWSHITISLKKIYKPKCVKNIFAMRFMQLGLSLFNYLGMEK